MRSACQSKQVINEWSLFRLKEDAKTMEVPCQMNAMQGRVAVADAAGGQGHTLQLSGREKEYTQVVNSLNEANLSKQRFDAVAAFAAAASRDPSGAVRLHRLVQHPDAHPQQHSTTLGATPILVDLVLAPGFILRASWQETPTNLTNSSAVLNLVCRIIQGERKVCVLTTVNRALGVNQTRGWRAGGGGGGR
jgi:hypothetical protein